MNLTRLQHGRSGSRARWIMAALAMLLAPFAASAAPSESGGTGVWDVPSAESKKAGHLGLGFFGSYRHLGLQDSLDTHLNDLRLGGVATFGIPGGFEVSGTLPIHGAYLSTESGSSPFDEDFTLRLGDVTGRLRWTTPIFSGLRWGLEGEATFATGSDHEVMVPTRGAVKPYTSGETDYAARSMLTWDARGAGRATALRLHAGAGYHFQGDESRYYNAHATLPLDLPTPTDDKENDFLSVFTAAELDLSRVTLFGELTSDQYVNQRGLIRGKENRVTVTPGIRFWLPGGLSLAGAYSMNLSEDDASTAFNPDHAFANNQLRVALSLGTIYRNASAVREAAEDPYAPRPAGTKAPIVVTSDGSPVDPVTAAKLEKDLEIRSRHETQEDQRLAPTVVIPTPVAPAPSATATPGIAPMVVPAPAPAMKAAPRAVTPPRFVDTDGDGIPDEQDQCPLMAEDWDGFQDFDGCPDLDNDRDGIPDIRDQCPNDPETYNGYYDFDGCPDVAPDTRKSMASPEATAPTSAALAPPATPKSPATTRTGAAAANLAAAASSAPGGAADSLRRALAVEQGRNAELLAQLIRAEQARAAADATPSPSPRPDPLLARDLQMQYELDAERRRSADLESRIRAVESANRNPVVIEHSIPAPAPTATSPGSAPLSQDNATRLRALEQELAGLRAGTDAAAKLSLPIPAPQPVDTTGQRILTQLSSIQAAMAERAAQEAEPALEPTADAMKTLELMLPLGTTRVFPEIQFESGSAQLQRGALQALDTMASVLRLAPDSRIDVVGHTDNVGRARANLLLSQERARAVAEALTLRGVSPTQLSVVGRGETMSIASNATAAGREANRRVEFTRSR